MGSIYTYVFVQVQNVCQSSWNNLRKFIFSFDHMTSGFQCPSVYRQTTDCTEGGGLTREHCKYNNILNISCLAENQQILILKFLVWPYQGLKPWSTTLTITLSINFVCCVNRIPYDCDFVNKTVLIIISFSAIS
jgi:hypothetical protein